MKMHCSFTVISLEMKKNIYEENQYTSDGTRIDIVRNYFVHGFMSKTPKRNPCGDDSELT